MTLRFQSHTTRLNPRLAATVREVVFGLEDSLVSTLGVVTGVAVGTTNYFVVILSGFVVVAVEALSMTAGSYVSSKSAREVEEYALKEEKKEVEESPENEREILENFYREEGMNAKDAVTTALAMSRHRPLFLKEMACHELKIVSDQLEEPRRNALLMGFTYIIGGLVPIAPYFFFSVYTAIPYSIIITLLVLFGVGALRTRYTRKRWWKSGLELMIISAGATLVGYLVAKFVEAGFGTRV